MKKILLVLVSILMIIPFGIFAETSIFVESVAGSMRVRGERIGVITVGIGNTGSKSAINYDDPLAVGLRMELINKGALVKVMNPAGMEQILAQFIETKKGQFSTKEEIAMDAGLSFKNFMTNTKGDITAGVQLLEKLLDANELSGEADRVSDYAGFYRKVIDLWGIDKLITVSRSNAFTVSVKGYDITSASATLIFQYEVRSNATNWQKITQYKDDWKISGTYGYTVIESADVKYEVSNKRMVEMIKRVSEFLKDTGSSK